MNTKLIAISFHKTGLFPFLFLKTKFLETETETESTVFLEHQLAQLFFL
jgi:hypothetical protein